MVLFLQTSPLVPEHFSCFRHCSGDCGRKKGLLRAAFDIVGSRDSRVQAGNVLSNEIKVRPSATIKAKRSSRGLKRSMRLDSLPTDPSSLEPNRDETSRTERRWSRFNLAWHGWGEWTRTSKDSKISECERTAREDTSHTFERSVIHREICEKLQTGKSPLLSAFERIPCVFSHSRKIVPFKYLNL